MSDATPKYSIAELNELEVLDVEALRRRARRNGREETAHARRVERAIAIKLGGEFAATAEMLERAPITLPTNVGPDLLRMIVQGELDGDAGYRRWADNETDLQVARLLRFNVREETIHGRRVEQAIALLG